MKRKIELKIDILEKNKIAYQVKISKAKRFRLYFNSLGILMISYPIGTKYSSLIEFIENNIEWVIKKAVAASSKMITYNNDSQQYVLGHPYQLKINISKTNRIDLIDNLMLVSVNKMEQVRMKIIEWRYEQAEIIFQEMLYQCFLKMEIELQKYPKLIIKSSKSKWGCCYFNENKIMLNVALTQVPPMLIEYVICHELTHFIVHNHSKEFHLKLFTYIPNEKNCRQELKKYSSIL